MDGKIWMDLRGLIMKVWDWFDRCYRFVFFFNWYISEITN